VAAKNGVVAVTDIPELPGAGQLHFEDGKPPIIVTPKIAEEYRQRLGPAPATTSTDIYGNAPGGAAPADYDRGGFSRASGPAPQYDHGGLAAPGPAAPAPGPTAPTAGPAAGAGPSAAPGATPSAGASPVPPTTAELGAAATDAMQRRAYDEVINGRLVPGSAGRAAGFAPTAQKVVTEAGPEYRTEDRDARAAVADELLAAQRAKAQADKTEADAQAAQAARDGLAAQQAVAAQRAENQRKQMEFQRQDAAMQKELADYSEEAKPDPKKFWSTPGGAVSGLLSIIGQGLGAFAAVRSGTENFAFKAAQQKMQMEMAAQEKAYDNGRGDRKNALARYTQFYNGDMEMGKLALSQALNKVAETETNRAAAQSRSKDITANARILAAQFAQQQLQNEQERRALAEGKTTRTLDEKYQSAIAASGAHRVALTPEQAAKELAAAAALKKGEAPDATRIEYGKKKEAEAPARSGLAKIAAHIGAVKDPETGKWVMPEGKQPEAAGHGRIAGKIPDAFVGQKGRDLRRDLDRVVMATGQMVSGADVPESQLDQIRKMSGAEGNDADLLSGLNRMQDMQDSAARERDATYGVDIVQAHEESKKKTDARARTSPANTKQTPVE